MNDGPLSQFIEAMAAEGLTPPKGIEADGKIHRYKPIGDKSSTQHAWYIFHMDAPASGAFGSWKFGVSQKWTERREHQMDPIERAKLNARAESNRKAKAEEEENLRIEAKAKAQYLWSQSHTPGDDNVYLKHKNIQHHGACRELKGALVIPLRDQHGSLESLQFIYPDGTKRFLTGGKKKGCYASVGRPKDRIIIAEGFATAISIFEATGDAVAVAFDAGNLEAVAIALRSKYPGRIIIAADNDQKTPGNPGVTAATKAALAISGSIAIPDFSPDHTHLSDFNDLALSRGHAHICELIDEAVLPAVSSSLSTPEDGSSADPVAQDANQPRDPGPPSPLRGASPEQTRDLPAYSEDIDGALAVVPIDETGIDFSPLPHMGGRGKVLSTIDNLKEVMRRLGILVRYNVIKKEEELVIPNAEFSIDNRANASIAWIKSWCARFGMPIAQTQEFITAIADQNLYNPAITWIRSIPWDGRSRLPDFYATVKATGEDQDPNIKLLKEILLRRWLISAVAALFEPRGVSAHGVLVFQGTQYMGKTAWFKRLVPQDKGLTADGMMLKPDDKDSIGQALSFWLVELGELDATFRKADIAQLKAFVTRDKDVFRKPYMPKPSEFARRTIFFASVNDSRFLQDTTGNRRFWTIGCESLDYSHNVDMQQLWAEVFALYDFGEPWILDREEMELLNRSNAEYQVLDPVEEKLTAGFKWNEIQFQSNWMTATDALEAIGWSKPSQRDLNRAGTIIRMLNGNERKYGQKGERLLKLPHKA